MNRPENADVASLVELAKSDLQEEDWDANNEEGNHVWNEEGATSIIGGKLREPPNIAKSGGSDGLQVGRTSEHTGICALKIDEVD